MRALLLQRLRSADAILAVLDELREQEAKGGEADLVLGAARRKRLVEHRPTPTTRRRGRHVSGSVRAQPRSAAAFASVVCQIVTQNGRQATRLRYTRVPRAPSRGLRGRALLREEEAAGSRGSEEWVGRRPGGSAKARVVGGTAGVAGGSGVR